MSMSFLRINLVRTEQGTEARYLLALTWAYFNAYVRRNFTLTSVAVVHSVRHFFRRLYVVLTDSNDEHALIR